jgi:DNA-binding NtrC family response regulator
MLNPLPALIVSSEAPERTWIASLVSKYGLRPVFCPNLTAARGMLDGTKYPVIFCSDRLPDGDLGVSLKSLVAAAPGAPIIVLSSLSEWDSYLRAIGAGAFDLIASPPSTIEAERILRLALGQSAQQNSHAA